jgi:transposase
MLKKVRKVMGKMMMSGRERHLANARQNSDKSGAENSWTTKNPEFFMEEKFGISYGVLQNIVNEKWF